METKEKDLRKLVILHSNDMHGDFMAENVDSNLVGGVGLLSGYINKVREEEDGVIYAIAGDMFRGSVIDSEFKGFSTVELMNMLGPDVVTVGNHETDYGVAHLLFIEKCAKFPIINANLHIRTNNARLFSPYHIVEKNGLKVLFIGILTEQVLSQTRNDGLVGTFVDVSEAADEIGRICNSFNSVDIDLTVLLTHIGFEEDKELAKRLDPSWGVDIIIGGHSHTFLKEPCVVNKIPIVQAGTGTDQIGRFDLVLNADDNCIDSFTWTTIPINEKTCPRDAALEELLTSYKSQTDVKYRRVVTRLAWEMTHPTRTQETELGNLFADALKESLGVDVMLMGSGSIRTERMGPIVLFSNLVETYPYEGPVYMVKMTGAQFKRAIKHMVRDEVWEGKHTEYYQLSKGFKIIYDRATHEFEQFDFNGEPLADDRILTVGMQKFHYLNMHEALNLKLAEVKKNMPPRIISTSDQQILDEYLSEHQLLEVEVEGRLLVK